MIIKYIRAEEARLVARSRHASRHIYHPTQVPMLPVIVKKRPHDDDDRTMQTGTHHHFF